MNNQLLENVVKTYRNLPVGFAKVVTVFVGSNSFTGRVVSSDKFMSNIETLSLEDTHTLIDEIKSITHANAENIDALQKQRTQIDHDGYIHLQDENEVIWRIAIADVTAWSVR